MKSPIKGHKVILCSKLFDLIKTFDLGYYGQLSSLFSLILVRKFILWQNYTFFWRNVASLGKIHILKIFTRFFCFRIYFRLRFGLKNLLNTYQRFKNPVVYGEGIFILKYLWIGIVIPNLNVIYFYIQKTFKLVFKPVFWPKINLFNCRWCYKSWN